MSASNASVGTKVVVISTIVAVLIVVSLLVGYRKYASPPSSSIAERERERGSNRGPMLTIIVPTYKRDPSIVKSVLHSYLDWTDLVLEVILCEFETGHHIDEEPSPKEGRTWKTQHFENDLRERFRPIMGSSGSVILITDDDVLVKKKYLRALVSKALEDPSHMHGVNPRKFAIRSGKRTYEPFTAGFYQNGQSVDMVLTSCLVGHRSIMERAARLFYEGGYGRLADRFNGEDIVFQRIFGRVRAWGWNDHYLYGVRPYLYPSATRNYKFSERSISSRPGHKRSRTRIVRRCMSHYLPLDYRRDDEDRKDDDDYEYLQSLIRASNFEPFVPLAPNL